MIFVEVDGVERMTIPLPAEPISANVRYHWAVKARMTKEWRGIGYQLARSFTRQQRCSLKVEFDWPDKRRRDPANYHPTLKAMVDGMVDAGFLPDDNDRYLDGPDPRRSYDVVRMQGQEKLVMMRITVTPLPPDPGRVCQ